METSGNEPQDVPSDCLEAPSENASPMLGGSVGPQLSSTSVAPPESMASAGALHARSTNRPETNLNDLESGGSYTIDPRFIPFSRLTSFLFTAVLFVGGVVGSFIVWWNQGENWITLLVASLCGVVILGFALLSWIWPPIEYRHVSWRLDSAGLEIHRGVFWQHRIAIPVARLQHADISQGPVQRPFGLAKLTVYTAGTAHSSIELDGLSLESATWLRDQLIRQREALDVV